MSNKLAVFRPWKGEPATDKEVEEIIDKVIEELIKEEGESVFLMTGNTVVLGLNLLSHYEVFICEAKKYADFPRRTG